MDRASSGKSDPPCFKQDQTILFIVQRRRKRAYGFIPSSSKSTIPNSKRLLIVMSSKRTIAITSER
jgi:hypothetical protein